MTSAVTSAATTTTRVTHIVHVVHFASAYHIAQNVLATSLFQLLTQQKARQRGAATPPTRTWHTAHDHDATAEAARPPVFDALFRYAMDTDVRDAVHTAVVRAVEKDTDDHVNRHNSRTTQTRPRLLFLELKRGGRGGRQRDRPHRRVGYVGRDTHNDALPPPSSELTTTPTAATAAAAASDGKGNETDDSVTTSVIAVHADAVTQLMLLWQTLQTMHRDANDSDDAEATSADTSCREDSDEVTMQAGKQPPTPRRPAQRQHVQPCSLTVRDAHDAVTHTLYAAKSTLTSYAQGKMSSVPVYACVALSSEAYAQVLALLRRYARDLMACTNDDACDYDENKSYNDAHDDSATAAATTATTATTATDATTDATTTAQAQEQQQPSSSSFLPDSACTYYDNNNDDDDDYSGGGNYNNIRVKFLQSEFHVTTRHFASEYELDVLQYARLAALLRRRVALSLRYVVADDDGMAIIVDKTCVTLSPSQQGAPRPWQRQPCAKHKAAGRTDTRDSLRSTHVDVGASSSMPATSDSSASTTTTAAATAAAQFGKEELVCSNDVPHITVACARGVAPKYSNTLCASALRIIADMRNDDPGDGSSSSRRRLYSKIRMVKLPDDAVVQGVYEFRW